MSLKCNRCGVGYAALIRVALATEVVPSGSVNRKEVGKLCPNCFRLFASGMDDLVGKTVGDAPGGAHRLPAGDDSVQPLGEHPRPLVETLEYGVKEWHPTPDGSGRPEQIHLYQHVNIHVPGHGAVEADIVMRMKSPRAADEVIAMLLRHRYSVWPDTPPQMPGVPAGYSEV